MMMGVEARVAVIARATQDDEQPLYTDINSHYIPTASLRPFNEL